MRGNTAGCGAGAGPRVESGARVGLNGEGNLDWARERKQAWEKGESGLRGEGLGLFGSGWVFSFSLLFYFIFFF